MSFELSYVLIIMIILFTPLNITDKILNPEVCAALGIEIDTYTHTCMQARE